MLTIKNLTEKFLISPGTARRWIKKPPDYIAEAIVAYNSGLTPLTSPQAAKYWKLLGVSRMTSHRWKNGLEASLVKRYAAAYFEYKNITRGKIKCFRKI